MRTQTKSAALLTLLMFASVFAGCLGGDETNVNICGEGTGLVGNECVPVVSSGDQVSFTLRAENMQFIGVGGEIDGQVNPILAVENGDIVTITLVMGESVQLPWNQQKR